MPAESPTRFTMVPARRSSEPTARKRARRILGALFLAASLSILAVLVSLTKGHGKPDLSAVDPKGRDLAYAAAMNYLSGTYQNVPHAQSFKPADAARAAPDLNNGQQSAPMPYQSVSWVGFTPEHFGSAKAGITDFEVHHFLVVLAGSPSGTTSPTPPPSTSPTPTPPPTKKPRNAAGPGSPTVSPSAQASSPATQGPSSSPGQQDTSAPSPSPSPSNSGSSGTNGATPGPNANVLQLDVPVLITPSGPRLAASPAFSVWDGGTGGVNGAGDYSNYPNLFADIGDSVKGQVATWAKAYVNGDSAGLLTLTGDQNSGHHYHGLAGFTLPNTPSAVQIMSAIKADKGQVIVRARVLLAMAVGNGTVSSGTGTAPQFDTFADFDLLVGAPNGARPPILAWGPAGSAAQLEPFSNAQNS